MKPIKAHKNIFIGGVARAGKSTIAEKIANNSRYNHFPVDYIATSFNKNFPDCGINTQVIIDSGSRNLSLFLSTVIEKMEKSNEKYVIDSAHIMPRDIIKYLDKEKWIIVFIGYPNVMPEEKFVNIRENDDITSWTRNFNDDEMLNLTKQLVELSKKIKKECLEYNIKFIDTSYNFIKTIDESVKQLSYEISSYEKSL